MPAHSNMKTGSDSSKPATNAASTGDLYLATDTDKMFMFDGSTWKEIGSSLAKLTLSGTVAVGDLIGYSSGWKQAANTAGSIIAAQFVALEAGVSGGVISVARRAVVSGSYTAGNQVYLGTAGATTTTRPTTAASLRQRVGVALSTTEALIEIKGLREVDIPIHLNGATSAYAVLDSGDFGGPTLDALNETLSLVAVLPENIVSVVIAKIFLAAEASVGTPTFDLTVSSAIDGAQWDAVVADATLANQALEGAAPDEMQVLDITTALDATDIIRPGAILGLKVLKDDAGTDISFVFGGSITALVAE